MTRKRWIGALVPIWAGLVAGGFVHAALAPRHGSGFDQLGRVLGILLAWEGAALLLAIIVTVLVTAWWRSLPRWARWFGLLPLAGVLMAAGLLTLTLLRG